MTMTMTDRLLTVHEACQRLHISRATFYRYMMRATKPGSNIFFVKIIKIGGVGQHAASRISEGELNRFIEGCKSQNA
jgi:predicted DNA-binding transcriptional regulator AlpA